MCIQSSSRCTNINEDPNDLKDQLCALMEGLRTLTRIVTMDDTSSEYVDDDRRIEELQSAWRLEDTGFSALYNCCKQMKDSLCLTSVEADEALIEVQETRKIAIAAKLSREKMKKKAIALQKENSELRNKNHLLMIELRDQKKQKKLIARSVKNFVGTLLEEHQLETRNVSTLAPDYIPSLPDVSNENSSEEEWEEVSNASSGSSLVTDDGCATVHLAQREPDTLPSLRQALKSIRWNNIIPTNNITKQKNELDLSFPSTNSGILLCAVPMKSSASTYSHALLVCGFTEFDDTLNQQPMFGSRLICVDGISLEREQWKMTNFHDYIASKSGPIKMSFRNELLNRAQIEQLKESSKIFGL